MSILAILSNVISPVKTIIEGSKNLLEGWQARKTAKLSSDLRVGEAVTNAKISRLQAGQQADIKWENLSIQNAGWKDEFWTIILAIPCVLCFFPGAVNCVREGFEALQGCPDWYKWCLLVAVGSSFGYRKLCDFMSLKKGD